jgi:RNase P subunit RPR2
MCDMPNCDKCGSDNIGEDIDEDDINIVVFICKDCGNKMREGFGQCQSQ